MVADFLSSNWKLALWVLYLVLNELSVTPMYSAVSSVALYTLLILSDICSVLGKLFCLCRSTLSLSGWFSSPRVFFFV